MRGRHIWSALLSIAFFIGVVGGGSAENCTWNETSLGDSRAAAIPSQNESAENGGPSPNFVKLPPALVLDDGSRRFALNPGHLDLDRYCLFEETRAESPPKGLAWTTGVPSDCKLAVDGVLAYVGDGGESAGRLDWAAVLGLAEPKIKAVVLELGDGSRKKLSLTPWPHSPWLSFEYPIGPRPFPRVLVAFDQSGQVVEKLDLDRFIRVPTCQVLETCEWEEGEGPRDAWAGSVEADPRTAFLKLTSEDAIATKKLIDQDRLLHDILDGRAYALEDVDVWPDCSLTRAVGTWARIRLQKAAVLEADWPFVELRRDRDTYLQRIAHRRTGLVRTIFILVDLARHRLVAIDPEVEESVPRFSDGRVLDAAWSGGPYPDDWACSRLGGPTTTVHER